MRRFVIALLSVTAVSVVSAQAADLPMKAPPPIPVYTTYSWSGCYVGAHAGGGWANTKWTNTADTTAFGDLIAGQSLSQTKGGFIGGGQLGCNYQIGQFVFGVEGTFSGSTIKGTKQNTTFGPAFDDVFTTRVNSVATVTGRVGYAMDNWLFYAKGGYAGGQVKFSVADNVGPAVGAGSATHWQNGWTIGGGVEYGLTQHWIVGVEYNYLDLGTKNYQVAGAAGGSYAFNVHPRIHEVLGRISYKFGP
jgi:outer membrane immunogenic protein